MTDTAQNWYAFDAYGHCVKLGNFGDYDAAFNCAEETLYDEWMFLMPANELLEIADIVRGDMT
jgi:hypothetical protein